MMERARDGQSSDRNVGRTASKAGNVGRTAGDRNVGRIGRWLSGIGGAALIGGALRERSVWSVLLAGGGAALIYRGVSGKCPVYRRLGIDTSSTANRRIDAMTLERAVAVMRSPAEVYAFWRRLDNLPLVMSHLESVTTDADGVSHWVAREAGVRVAWDARITDDEPGRRIAWRSLPGGDVDTEGSVEMAAVPHGRGTVVRVSLRMEPPGGVVGQALAPLFERITRAQLGHDLRRLRQLLDTGELATNAVKPTERTRELTGMADRRRQTSEEPVAASEATSGQGGRGTQKTQGARKPQGGRKSRGVAQGTQATARSEREGPGVPTGPIGSPGAGMSPPGAGIPQQNAERNPDGTVRR